MFRSTSKELVYAASSFAAIFRPVCWTMILAALAVHYVNTEQTKEAGEEALARSYQVFDISDEQSAATSIGLGLINSLIIVSGIGMMTFVLVLLYKYRCMKCLIAYMVFASTALLGFLGSQMFMLAIQKYGIPLDWVTFVFVMYNFAITGVIAVFYQKGMPTYINQGYLVLTSVIVAWQLSYFNEWMSWTLLIALALYDLCAVLTPCGPLKALVNEMSKDDAPSMPGLLYEAGLPANAVRPGRPSADADKNNDNRRRPSQNRGTESASSTEDETVAERPSCVAPTSGAKEYGRSQLYEGKLKPKGQTRGTCPESSPASSAPETPNLDPEHLRRAETDATTLPLAIAKVYKLPLVLTSVETIDASTPTAYLNQDFGAADLRSKVKAVLPRRGGRIETVLDSKGEENYAVYNKDGELKRTLLVDKRGKVMEVVPGDEDDEEIDNNIKLGLGDFIFYSVLVSKGECHRLCVSLLHTAALTPLLR